MEAMHSDLETVPQAALKTMPMNRRVTRALVRQQVDTFLKQGMYQKARDLYQKMLGASPQLPPEVRSGIEGQMRQIELHATSTSGSAEADSGRSDSPGSGGRRRSEISKLLENIADGSITIESTDAFRRILNQYPEEPELLRIYAGRLVSESRTGEAVTFYAGAAVLFFKAGMIFKGWLCKLLEWRIQKAGKEQLAGIQETIWKTPHRHPIDEFVKQLTWAERASVFSKFRLISLPKGQTVVAGGEGPRDLYIVVSGVLKEIGPDSKPKRSKSRMLSEGNFFGFSGSTIGAAAHSDVIAVARAELVKISREHLLSVIRRFPKVEQKLQLLYQKPEGKRSSAPERTRKGERYSIRTFMHLSILPLQPGEQPLVLKGFSHEISLTGVGFVPEQNGAAESSALLKSARSLIGRKVNAKILAEGISVEVQGQIVRANPVIVYGDKLLCFAVKFADLSPLVRWMLFTFAANASVHLPLAEHKYLFSCPLDHTWRI